MTFTERVPERAIADCVEAGVTSFKLYMAYPELLQVDDDVIVDMMTAAHAARRAGHPALRERRRHRSAAAPGARRRVAPVCSSTRRPGPRSSRPRRSQRAASLAEVAGASVYVVHLSSAPALAAVREARERGVDVIAETCPQYLYLDTARLTGPDGESFVCTPPLRDPWHVEELWHGMATGRGAHRRHRPLPVHRGRPARRHRRARRRAGPTSPRSPAVCPASRPASGWCGKAWSPGASPRADWVRLCAEAPARTFGLWPTKGNLRVGADADVVVWDPAARASRSTPRALHMARRPLALRGHHRHRLARPRAVTRRHRRARRRLRRRTRPRPLRRAHAEPQLTGSPDDPNLSCSAKHDTLQR